MTEEAPKYYTNTLSPISPLPVHPPEPEKIPILQNQIDPVFNMTSTHLVPDLPSLATSAEPLPEPTPADSPSSSHSSFSDAYAEEPEPVTSHTIGDAEKGAEDSDDYAMTFDSDAEDQADNEEVLRAVAEPASNTLPIITNTTNLSAPPTSMDYASAISDMPTIGQDLLQTHTHINLSPPHSPSNERARAHAYDDPVAQTAAAAESASSTYEDTASSGIDIQQLLDNITANAEKNAPPSANGTPPLASPSLIKSGSGLPSHASLPPRPNVPQKRPFHEDIQKYHAGVPGIPPASSAFRAGTTGSLVAAGAPGTSTDPRGGLPPPPTGSFQSPSSGNISPTSYSQINKLVPGVQSRANELQDEADDIDAKWGPDVQKIYDQFIDNERMYVTEGLWDRFPVGSRLFIGNLPSEKVTKRDLFHVFHKYGKIAQISIKQAYGFVQFHESSACHNALKREEGSEVRGRKMHLEISKPQKNSRNAQNGAAATSRRSRSPDRQRGSNGRGVDRYDGRGAPRIGQDEYGRPLRIRDDYRSLRSPSPRDSFRGRDEYAPRTRDSYDVRDRRRSRSRSPPYGQRDSARYRERSPSPRSREAMEDASLSIPRRDPRDAPDVQIILLDQLDPQFVSWVEKEMQGRGVKVEVMFLSPRLPLQAVIRRQILEGVHAVSKLDMRAQNTSKVSLQVFDRQGGINNIRFDEYQDLEPKIAAELTLRTKNSQQPQSQNPPAYSQPFPTTQPYQQPAPVHAAPTANLASLVGQLDNATLQKILGSLSAGQPQVPPQQQNSPTAAPNSTIDLAGFLGGFQQQQQQQPPQQVYTQPQPMQNSYPMQATNQGYGLYQNGLTQQQQQQQQPTQQSAQQVQNIMAQLARFRQ